MAVVLMGVTLAAWTAPAHPGPGDDQKKKKEPVEDFLVFCNVYNEQGYSLAGAEIGVRRADEKKARWQGSSDRRGEYAVRVPLGTEYEVSVSAKGYAGQSHKVDAREGNRQVLVFRMQPSPEGKKK